MRIHHILTALLVPVVLALVVGSAAAQEYRIVSADYGFRRERVDVTDRLRELARENATFRMGNSTFGIDPSPGNVKTLRIFAIGPDGRSRTFEYREGGVVDGSLFSGWGRGEWARSPENGQAYRPEYMILRALYGVARRNVDVTERLRELASRDAAFRMGNSTFGVDPAPGRVKTLRIWARRPGEPPRLFEYQEGSFVDGAQFSGWRAGSWGDPRWNGGWEGGRR
jgi:hypothetical protein